MPLKPDFKYQSRVRLLQYTQLGKAKLSVKWPSDSRAVGPLTIPKDKKH